MSGMTPERVRESCREDVDDGERCGETADLILWGRLLPADALGPRCLFHAGKYIPTDPHSVSQYAVYDLRPVGRLARELADRSTQTRWGQEHDRRDRVRLLDAVRNEPEVRAVTARIEAGEQVEAPQSEAILPLLARLREQLAAERAKIAAVSRWLDEDEAQALKPGSHWPGCTAPGGGECTCTRDLGTWNRSRLNRIAERRAALTAEPEAVPSDRL